MNCLRRAFCLVTLFLSFSAVIAQEDSSPGILPSYQPLFERLAAEGMDPEFLAPLFADPRTEPIRDFMKISMVSKEVPELYAQFLSADSVNLAKSFLRQNLKTLKEMEHRFQVEKEIVVAILLIESRFGENIGKHRVIPTLASIALMDSPQNVQDNYLRLRETDSEIPFERVEGIARRKASWAYKELKCFLQIVGRETMDPLEFRGSYAGALGMAQFLPSSYLAYALSEKSLENWLISREEAIFSIGNYLKSQGWKRNLPEQRKRRLLWTYNRSEPYIGTVLEVARRIGRQTQ
jgi:membrane-bound lytic murein transglycosylase B